MIRIQLSTLTPTTSHPTGSIIGDEHARQIIEAYRASESADAIVLLDFVGIAAVSASYLKRITSLWFTDEQKSLGSFASPALVLANVSGPDLLEDIETFLRSKDKVALLASSVGESIRFSRILGALEGAAAETFEELQKWTEVTAQVLYERYPNRTTNQTAWNNRLAQLFEMRIARRRKEGRLWIYSPTISF